ncbi:MAG: hypothetical protein K2X66_08095 [Cyanobacteria bacterium]|nr:hypothetical protein [Cyanobacteriota bacterium]
MQGVQPFKNTGYSANLVAISPKPFYRAPKSIDSNLITSPNDVIRFGHGGDGDHFHPMAPVDVYGKSNPFFKPLMQALLKISPEKFVENQFADEWILNPETDGVNNLRSLHLLIEPETLEKSLALVPFFQRPKSFRFLWLGSKKALSPLIPIPSVKKSLVQSVDQEKKTYYEGLANQYKHQVVFPLLYYGLITSPKADKAIRDVAAKMLIWDYIEKYNPAEDQYELKTLEAFRGFTPSEEEYDEGRWGKHLMRALTLLVQHEKTLPEEKSNLKSLAKIFAHKAYAWPHEAYQEAQKLEKESHSHGKEDHHHHSHSHGSSHNHSHSQAHSHHKPHHHSHGHSHGHSHNHDEMLTVHRPEGWDAPKQLDAELGKKLLVLPLSQPIRPTVSKLLSPSKPEDWFTLLCNDLMKLPGNFHEDASH